MRLITVFLLVCFVAAGCRTNKAPGRPDPAAAAAAAAYMDAAIAQDREKLKTLVLLPEDPERRNWVLHVIDQGELAPPGTRRRRPRVTMDGPVAVCRVKLPDDGAPPGAPPPTAFLVRREGQWKVVIDYFQGGGLTPAEMSVIERHLTGSTETETDDGA